MSTIGCMTRPTYASQLVDRSGVGLDAFAEEVGCTPRLLSRLVDGEAEPERDLLRRMVAASNRIGRLRADQQDAERTAERMQMALGEGDTVWAFKLAVQAAELIGQTASVEQWRDAPSTNLDRRWFALLAALTARSFERLGTPPPAWTAVAPLPEAWTPLAGLGRKTAPAADMSALNIVLDENDLMTVVLFRRRSFATKVR